MGSGISVVKMPYKDKQKRIEYKKRWDKKYYATHRQEELDRVRKRKKQLRKWFNGYKQTLVCSKCGENHPACLEFHHLNEKTKSFRISEAIEQRGCSKDRIMSEISKCIVLCANCHKKLHAN